MSLLLSDWCLQSVLKMLVGGSDEGESDPDGGPVKNPAIWASCKELSGVWGLPEDGECCWGCDGFVLPLAAPAVLSGEQPAKTVTRGDCRQGACQAEPGLGSGLGLGLEKEAASRKRKGRMSMKMKRKKPGRLSVALVRLE